MVRHNFTKAVIATGLGLGMTTGSAICAYKSVSQPVQFTVCKTILEEAINTMSLPDDTDLHQDAVYTLDRIKQIDPKYAGSYLEHAKSNLIRIAYSDAADVNSSNNSLKTFTRGVIADNLRDARTEAYAVENNRSGSWALPALGFGLCAIADAYLSFGFFTGRLLRRRDLRDAGP